MQRSNLVVQHLQRDLVLRRSTISRRGFVLILKLNSVERFYCLCRFHLLKGVICIHVQRRRDRINEKMRALQELIPRCNKVVVFFYQSSCF